MNTLIMLILLGLTPFHEEPGEYECDQIVLNNVYNDEGNIYLSQLLFIEADIKTAKWSIRQWEITSLDKLSIYKKDGLFYYFLESEGVFIKAPYFSINHSDKDLEVESRKQFKNHLLEEKTGITPAAKHHWKIIWDNTEPMKRPRLYEFSPAK